MNIKLIACKVLERELSFIRRQSDHYIDISFLEQGLHNEPDRLREVLQNEIDAVDENYENHSCRNKTYDAIVIGYGLCSNGITGISSRNHILVVPKAHDCITLLLGSKEKYREYFDKYNGGIYWYSPGWIENALMPSKERYNHIYNDYLENYGEDNAEYLMKMEQNWMTEYTRCTYVNWRDMEFAGYINYSKECAHFMNWEFEQLEGSSSLLSDLLNCRWDNDKFAVIPPNCKVEPSLNEEIITFCRNKPGGR